MHLVSISENKNIEKRIAVTPEIAKKYISAGFSLSLIKNYGAHLGFNDQEYIDLGVNFSDNENNLINDADILIQLGLLSDEKISSMKENQTLIGVLNPYDNKDRIDNLLKKKY